MSSPFGSNEHTHYDRDGLPIPPPSQQPGYPMYSQFASPAQYQAPAYPPVQQKSQVMAALLAFFLGTLGVHNFYLGYTGRGVAQAAMTVIGWMTLIFLVGGIFLMVVGVWVFIEFILILLRSGAMGSDARGVPLR